jgi:LEA14-like dessication related protein
MKKSTVAVLGTTLVGIGAIALYGKKQFDMISNDLVYGFDKSSIKVNTSSINRVSMSMDLTVDNKGELDIDAKDLGIEISTGKLVITKISRNNTFKIAPNSSSPIKIELFFNPEEIIRGSKDINITNWKQISLMFKGSLKVKKLGMWIPIPFKFTYKVSEFM